MRLINARRISQVFFLALFIWFCLVAGLGDGWWQLRGWPVNWFMELDPLLGLATLLATGALFAGLIWGLLTVGLTLILGRFFCGWVCPLGTIHHAASWLAWRKKSFKQRLAANAPGRARVVKYYLLAFLLAAAGAGLVQRLERGLAGPQLWLAGLGLAALLAAVAWRIGRGGRKGLWALGLGIALWLGFCLWLSPGRVLNATLQTGLLDPIPLLHRSLNLALLPLVDPGVFWPRAARRYFEGGWFILALFALFVGLNLKTPRFYCRYLCPLGALFGVLARFAPLGMGKSEHPCRDCRACESLCAGGSSPADALDRGECLLCQNCRPACPDGLMTYAPAVSAGGASSVDITRRGLAWSLAGGLVLAPALRIGGLPGFKRPGPVRPPGSLPEPEFLARCTKCGQCMRICPSGVIQPADLQAGLEGLWTPVLNFRLGTGGCLHNCVACGNLCPTAAIRPLGLDERMGKGSFAAAGPVRIGTAFVDRGRCLPWAMNSPCIVCQENCPVSPKAIITSTVFEPAPGGSFKVKAASGGRIELAGAALGPGVLAGGDYYATWDNGPKQPLRIKANGAAHLELDGMGGPPPAPGQALEVQVRLQRPVVDPGQCIGCGACEHVCPLKVVPAIRVTSENQNRAGQRTLLPAPLPRKPEAAH